MASKGTMCKHKRKAHDVHVQWHVRMAAHRQVKEEPANSRTGHLYLHPPNDLKLSISFEYSLIHI